MSKLYIMQGNNREEFVNRIRGVYGENEGECAVLGHGNTDGAENDTDKFYMNIGTLVQLLTHDEWEAIVIDGDHSSLAQIAPFSALAIAHGYEPIIVRTDDSIGDTMEECAVVSAADVELTF